MADQKGHLSFTSFFEVQDIREKLKHELVRQLEKDLGTSIPQMDPRSIFAAVQEALENARQQSRLAHILYRVDVNEADAYSGVASEDPMAALALAVIRREAQKVVFRQQYGNS